MRVLALEPYAAASHVAFLEGYRASSAHSVERAVMPARHWKWRMRTASLALRERVTAGAQDDQPFDALLVSDYLNLAELRALLPRSHRNLPAVVYFHENQLTYPLRTGERRDVHHGLVNVHSALTADRAVFNSAYHRRVFLAAATELLEQVPEVDAAPYVRELEDKCFVTPLGTDVERGQSRTLAAGEPPVLLWNHRWEYDKAPEIFAAALDDLDARGFDFRLRLLGQRFRTPSPALAAIEAKHTPRLLENGHAKTRSEYLAALDASHLAISTSRHEFFGLATLEALRRGLVPVLPDDLAYPELLPAEGRQFPYLYARERRPKQVADAIEAATKALWARNAPQGAFLEGTERFRWKQIAQELDAHVEFVTN